MRTWLTMVCALVLSIAFLQPTVAMAQEQHPPAAPAAPVAPPAPQHVPAPPAPPAPPAEWAGDMTVSDVLPVPPGSVQSLTLRTPAGKERRYLLSVSSNYRPGKAAPVLFGFGGWQDTPENYRSYARFGTTGALHEAIVVYPEGLERAWEGAPYSVSGPGEDIAFVRQILDVIDRDYRIDRNRVYATGMSNGGGMSAVLGCHAQDIFAGVAMVSAAYYNPVEINCANKPIPVLIIHGTADKLTHYEGGMLHNAPYLPVQTVLDGYARRNACHAVPPVVTPREGHAEHIVYQGCRANTEHLKIHGADHSWNYTPDVANEVWNFLARQHKAPAPSAPSAPPAPPAHGSA